MLWCSAAAHAQPLSEAEAIAIAAVVDEAETQNAPGIAVGIVRGGDVVFEQYRGLADLSHNVAIGPETRFNLASLAKQFTAAMVLDLSQAGLIDLDADIRTYLPDVLPEIDQPITVRHLIEHRSGLRDVYDLWSLSGFNWYERALTNEDAIRLLAQQRDLNFAPGSAHLYSNSNYIVLAELVAAIAQEPFADHAASFFDRYGMSATRWRPSYGTVVPHQAEAYYRFDDWFRSPDLANLHGDGFLWTTLADQLQYEALVQDGSGTLLMAAQARPDVGDYGYGLEHDVHGDVPRISHVGSTGAYNAVVIRYPEQAVSVVVMGNNATLGVVPMAYRIADLLVAEDVGRAPAYPSGPESIGPRLANGDVVGRYEQEGGSIIAITERDGRLFRELAGRDPVELLHEDGNLFAYASNTDLKIQLEGERFRIFLPSKPVATFVRLAPVPDDDARLASIEGAYANDETGAVLRIERTSGTDYRVTDMRGVGDAQMIADDDIFWNGTRLRFQRDDDGEVTRLLYTSGRLANVEFLRITDAGLASD
ncbi:Serine-type D-Ala-D-Ala carboxypeptidase [Aurantiacibacter gangjinensis]|uniref:Uncharacterized protein n=1 Tax=Aurantiacibacter gangjinensis TaxID=502682 RepID=A0A0G9MR11_9SPHN|nr:Serine-type D-Ala-D-Ala carboxypeptidase [Aurantiacibacter gangjinensis]KLE33049.1 hypothetical protein AAW01_03360 [Aurantiacibacter gangjinensis]